MHQPTVSVIVPVYKAAAYLDACVRSLVGQTFQDLQIILVNDGSPDESPAMCRRWAQSDARIQVLDKANGGLSSARNAGLDVATGKYLSFIDSDDYVHPAFYERLVAAMTPGTDFVSSETTVVTHHEAAFAPLPETLDVKTVEGDAVYFLALTDSFNNLCAKIYRRELFEGLRFKEGIAYEDVEIMEPLMKRCQRGLFLQFCGYHYFKNPNGISKRRNLRYKFDRFESFLRNLDIARERYPAIAPRCEALTFKTAASLLFWNCRLKTLSPQEVQCLRHYLNSTIERMPFNQDKLRAGLALRCPTFCELGLRFVK